MIVDDESLALSRLKRLLNENGVEDITAFDNPIEALKEVTKSIIERMKNNIFKKFGISFNLTL